MTALDKKITRKAAGLLKNGMVVTLYPTNIIGIREARCHNEYTLPLMTVYKLAIQAEYAAAKARKAAERKAKFGK